MNVFKTVCQGLLGLLAALAVTSTQSAELVQGFVNPGFGGSPLNSTYLFGVANAVNSHTAPKTAPTTASTSSASTSSVTPTDGDLFVKQLNSLVLSALANRLVGKAFGTSATDLPKDSTIDTGVNTITVQSVDNGTNVTIVDNKTGSKTMINVPNY